MGLLISTGFHAVLGILLLITLVALPLAPGLVRLLAPGFGREQTGLTAALTLIMLPATIFMGLAGSVVTLMYSAFLNLVQWW